MPSGPFEALVWTHFLTEFDANFGTEPRIFIPEKAHFYLIIARCSKKEISEIFELFVVLSYSEYSNTSNTVSHARSDVDSYDTTPKMLGTEKMGQ